MSHSKKRRVPDDDGDDTEQGNVRQSQVDAVADVKALNIAFARWIAEHAIASPSLLWIDGARDYIKHAEEIVKAYKRESSGKRANTTSDAAPTPQASTPASPAPLTEKTAKRPAAPPFSIPSFSALTKAASSAAASEEPKTLSVTELAALGRDISVPTPSSGWLGSKALDASVSAPTFAVSSGPSGDRAGTAPAGAGPGYLGASSKEQEKPAPSSTALPFLGSGSGPAFGASMQAASSGGVFGAAGSSGGLFGSSSSTPAFGTSALASSAPLFGGSAGSGGGLFGSSAASPFGQPASGGIFGSLPSTASAFSFASGATGAAGAAAGAGGEAGGDEGPADDAAALPSGPQAAKVGDNIDIVSTQKCGLMLPTPGGTYDSYTGMLSIRREKTSGKAWLQVLGGSGKIMKYATFLDSEKLRKVEVLPGKEDAKVQRLAINLNVFAHPPGTAPEGAEDANAVKPMKAIIKVNKDGTESLLASLEKVGCTKKAT